MAWSKAIDFMRFHGVLLGCQHEIWSKQHNGKVRKLIPMLYYDIFDNVVAVLLARNL